MLSAAKSSAISLILLKVVAPLQHFRVVQPGQSLDVPGGEAVDEAFDGALATAIPSACTYTCPSWSRSAHATAQRPWLELLAADVGRRE